MIPVLAFLRILLGIFFLAVGGAKLLAPYQNFLYVVQSYQTFSPPLEEIAARVVPWIEFFIGLFLALGLWLKKTLIAFLFLLSAFLVILGQAILRGMSIDCGCFGEWLKVPIQITFLMDSCQWLLAVFMLRQLQQTSRLSLDNYFSKN